MSTIYDIAKLCETSAATVSYVLNGRGDEKRISKATQDRILSAAERLSYTPNLMARQLKTPVRRALRIAAFWPEFYFEQSMVSAMRAINNISHLSAENLEVSVHYFMPDCLSEVWNRTELSGFNGVVLAGASMNDLAVLAEKPLQLPVVLVNRQCEGFASASVDHERAGRTACDLAWEYGGSEICVVWDSRFHVATNLRRSAFQARAQELGLDLADKEYTCEGSSDAGYTLGIRLLQKNQLRRVLYCNNEAIARGLAVAFHESGLKLGEDLLFFTANNGPDTYCRYMVPPLTVINLRMREVFEAAMKLCLSAIAHPNSEKTAIMLQPEVRFRESMPKKES